MVMRNNTMYIKSDTYFNDPACATSFTTMGYDVQPVDIFGGFVPQNKSLSNLAKTQKAIQERFGLETPGE